MSASKKRTTKKKPADLARRTRVNGVIPSKLSPNAQAWCAQHVKDALWKARWHLKSVSESLDVIHNEPDEETYARAAFNVRQDLLLVLGQLADADRNIRGLAMPIAADIEALAELGGPEASP